jgi:uncharacterized protein (TIGR02145 family)
MNPKNTIRFCLLLLIIVFSMLTYSCKKDDTNNDPEPGGTVTDIDGNVYHTVTIGTQTWMVENLKTTHYRDGEAIPYVTDSAIWNGLSTPAYCFYNNDAVANKATYGALYNWYTASSPKLCPVGWHVPTDAEWTTLMTYLGGQIVAGGKLKEQGTAHWNSPNTGADNSTGFTAVPGGCRTMGLIQFYEIGTFGYWWSSTETSAKFAWYRYILTNVLLLV